MIQTIWSASALLPGGWAESVEIELDKDGDVTSVSTDTPYSQGERAEVLIPGIPNVHSHAHQRAMAGLGERAGQDFDNFWNWRKIMYHYLASIEPQHLFNISAMLYLEMLKSGYTSVGEFQYLHHQIDGRRYDNPAEMSLQSMNAAASVGIGFTALPVLYRYGGFGEADPLPEQKRFLNDGAGFVRIVDDLQSASEGDANTSVGIAPHSLRATSQSLLGEVIDNCGIGKLAAIHIHIAEQAREVDECIAWSRQRPVEWLLDHFEVDQNWCLIHATHMNTAEISDMAKTGCVAGLCPTTEANLGDGFFNAVDYIAAGGQWAIGSDSHISVDPVEELRWLEYGQRLSRRNRNLLASEQHPNTGRNLLEGALRGGAQACGRKIGRIETGYRADFLALDAQHPRLYGRVEDELIDSWIFSGNTNLVDSVYVGGKKIVDQGHHAEEDSISRNFRQTLDELAN